MTPARRQAVRVLHQVQRAGYILEPDDQGGLVIAATDEASNPHNTSILGELQARVRAHKDELLAMFDYALSLRGRLDIVPTDHPHSDVLSYPVRWIPKLPAPSTFWLEVGGFGGRAAWTTSRERYMACARDGVPAFHAKEFVAATIAAEMDKARPRDLARWCARKAENASWRLTQGVALGLAQPASDASSTLWRALGLLGAELMDAVVEVPGEGLAKAEPVGEPGSSVGEGSRG